MHRSTRVIALALLLGMALALPGMIGPAAAQDGDDIVSTVNGQPIPRAQFHARVRLVRWQYLHELETLYEATGGSMGLTPTYVRTRVGSLSDPATLGEDVLYLLEQERLLWQKGEELGLTPTAEDARAQEERFFSLWTNVPLEQLAASETAQAFIDEWYAGATAASGMSADDIRILFETEALRRRLYEHVAASVPREEPAVHTRHILCAYHPDNIADPAPPTAEERAAAKTCAESALIRLANGEGFGPLAMELSDDLASAQRGGDVGWQFLSYLAEPYAEAVREAELNTAIGPVETDYGYHVIEVLERGQRELSDAQYAESTQGYFDLWVQSLRDNATIERQPGWDAGIPATPDLSALDAEIQAAIADLMAQ